MFGFHPIAAPEIRIYIGAFSDEFFIRIK